MDDISILIPFRSDNGPRERIFRWVCDRYATLFPKCEIVVGENKDRTFSRAKARNNAAVRADRTYFLFADADVYIADGALERARESVDEASWLIPYTQYTKIGPRYTERLLSSTATSRVDLGDIDREGPTHDSSRASLQLMHRDMFFGVNGFDHRFVGWGAEDQAFTDALEGVYGPPTRVEAHAFHLYHPTHISLTFDQPFHDDGIRLWERYKALKGNREAMLKFLFARRYVS